MTLLDFLGGDKTTGPSCGMTSVALWIADSPFRMGLGRSAGFVGAGTVVKYLHREKKGKVNGTQNKQSNGVH